MVCVSHRALLHVSTGPRRDHPSLDLMPHSRPFHTPLLCLQAAAHGAPTVATANGGPVDIMATLHHGVTVDPTDTQAVIAALLKILTNSQTWDEMSKAGVNNIMAYSWPSHVKRYVEALDAEVRFIKSYKASGGRG